MQNSKESSLQFFDSLAQRWDGFHDLEALAQKLYSGLKSFGVKPHERVLDVGCGTGNLTAALMRHLCDDGCVTAVDLSEVMIEKAKLKVNDSRVTWVCGPVEELTADNESFDRIICYSVWPHLYDTVKIGTLFQRWLKPGGHLHIWHTISREMVNKIHSEASAAVKEHQLAPATETAALLEQYGFIVELMQDDSAGYCVTAQKG